MYTRTSDAIIADLIPRAREYVDANDRGLYSIFFKRAEGFLARENILVGGRAAVGLLTAAIDGDITSWDLYCENPMDKSRRLADHLYNTHSRHISTDTIVVETVFRHKEFTIAINNRIIFRMFNIGVFRGVSVANIIRPVVRHGIACMPDEIHLIDVYRTLYRLDKHSGWSRAIDDEQQLFAAILARSKRPSGKPPPRVDMTALSSLIRVLPGAIVIGSAAAELYTGEPSGMRLQLICNLPEADMVKAIRSVWNGVKYKKYVMGLPGDFQTNKYVFSSSSHIVDIFDSTTFELVPTRQVAHEADHITCGNLWVILRFMMIDIYTVGGLAGDVSARVYAAAQLRELMIGDAENLFQIDGYAGVYIDESAMKRRLLNTTNDFFPPYYPVIRARRNPVVGGADDSEFEGSAIVDVEVDTPTKARILRDRIPFAGESAADVAAAAVEYRRDLEFYAPWGHRPAALSWPSPRDQNVAPIFARVDDVVAAAIGGDSIVVNGYDVVSAADASNVDWICQLAGAALPRVYTSARAVDDALTAAGFHRNEYITGDYGAYTAVYGKKELSTRIGGSGVLIY